MIHIDKHLKHVKFAKEQHVNKLLPILIKRVSKLSDGKVEGKVKKVLTNSMLKALLIETPEYLIDLNSQFYKEINNYTLDSYIVFKENLKIKQFKKLPSNLKSNRNKYQKLHNTIEKVFNYKSFIKKRDIKNYDGYHLANNLDFETCVYCNRLYTKTVVNGLVFNEVSKIIRPEFDHWFPKSKYPLLALSFYNLIPSCHVCNSNIKGDDDVSLNTQLHPYLDKDEYDKIKFSYVYNSSIKDRVFSIKSNSKKADNTIKAFKLNEVYGTHLDELNDLVMIKDKYSDKYLENLQGILGVKNLPRQDIYRLAFGSYYDREDYHKRPLSKMKKDILAELGIISINDEK